ncbi:unnamed protein product, partial [Rotaria sp. Silwood2]
QTIDLLIFELDGVRRLCRNSIKNTSNYDVLIED